MGTYIPTDCMWVGMCTISAYAMLAPDFFPAHTPSPGHDWSVRGSWSAADAWTNGRVPLVWAWVWVRFQLAVIVGAGLCNPLTIMRLK
eukprot:1474937-Pleurochrysis_carterae.AAC.1